MSQAEAAAADARLAELRETLALQQLKTFTRWWNAVLAPRDLKVQNLVEDVRPGVLPIALYEELSGDLVRHINASPTSRFQMLENQNVFLSSLKEKGLRLVNIGGADLVDGNRTLLLGLTWTIILRYEIQKYGADEQELLRWIKQTTAGYKDVNIRNWGDSFDDGLAFCALIHKHEPASLDYSGCDKAKPMHNLEQAFTVAEQQFGVPRLLEPEDLVREGKSDERSIITYAAKLRQAFGDKERELRRQMEEEAKRREEEERRRKREETQRLKSELSADAAALERWAKAKDATFRDAASAKTPPEVAAKLGATEAEVEKKLAALRGDFRAVEKPPKAAEKARLASLYEKVRGQLLANAMMAGDADGADDDPALAAAAPEAMQRVWTGMEGAERDYEAALLARQQALAAERRAKETDEMLSGLSAAATSLIDWTTSKTDDLLKGAHPNSLRDADGVRKAQDALDRYNADERPPKNEETLRVQRDLHHLADRLEQEGRDPPPPFNDRLNKAWGTLDGAAASLQRAIDDAKRQQAKAEAEAKTDAMKEENDGKAAAWLEAVERASNGFDRAVATGDLGSTKEETSAKLAELRDGHQAKARPKWAEERAAFEADRQRIDERRRAEERPPAAWSPTPEAVSSGWVRMTASERAYEEALLKKLGQLQAEDAERIRLAALRNSALSTLADLLPPFMQRRRIERMAADNAKKAAVQADELLPWVEAQQQTLEGRRAAVAREPQPAPQLRSEIGSIRSLEEGDKVEKQQVMLKARATFNDATAVRQLQRAGGGEPEAPGHAAIPALERAWLELEKSESALKSALLGRLDRLQGIALEWERLRRGCMRVTEWMHATVAVRGCTDLGSSEHEVLSLLREAEFIEAELALHAESVSQLQRLAERLYPDEEYGPMAREAFASVEAVPSLRPPLADRIKILREALERQRRLAAERQAFSIATSELEHTVSAAQELSCFPVDTFDTALAIESVLEQGNSQASKLLPAPEGATPEAVERAEGLVHTWQELAAALPARAAGCERSRRAALVRSKLYEEYAAAATAFGEWHAKCMQMLTMPKNGVAVSAKDAERAAAIAQLQLAEGDAHLRSAREVVRVMQSYDIADGNPSIVTLAEMRNKLEQVRSVAEDLHAAAQQAPPLMPREPVVKAIDELAEADGKRSSPGRIAPEALDEALPGTHAAFLHDELEKQNGGFVPNSFDPFPADRSPVPALQLPVFDFDLRSHALAVVEHVNRARSDPPAFAEHLKMQLNGCFDGTVFNIPASWGARRALRTVEGEAAVTNLISELKTTKEKPVLRLVPALSGAAQQLADELAAGKAQTPLMERLSGRGTFSGSAGEAVVYGVRQPEGTAVQLLISDGDKQRRNRNFLLNSDLKVAGFGLADHPQHDSVCVLTFATLFAPNLKEKVTVECQGDATPAFQDVLDAVPSQQARDIATDALVTGKKVRLEYAPGSVNIVVFERDGSQRSSVLKWN